MLANLFLGHHEDIWLNKYQRPYVQFYRRFVGDCFCLSNTEDDTLSLFDVLSSQNASIKFIVKKENNIMLAFLDVCINNKDPSCLLTSLHPRNTFTRLLNNLFSFLPCRIRLVLFVH